MHTHTSTQGRSIPEYPNTIKYQRRNWEVLGYWWNDAGEAVGYQLRSLDERRELRAIKLSVVRL